MNPAAKKAVSRILRPLLRQWATRARLVADLRSIGVKEGGDLLVHSSLSSLGFVPSGHKTVIAALEQAIGSEGTLVLPTHTWLSMNQNGREFDVRGTGSCVGSLSEAFRQLPSVVRSLHPTHSVAARGPRAEYLTSEHHLAETPCGQGTPYARLLDNDGQILLLGVGLNRNTAFHTIEALVNAEYLMQPHKERFTVVRDTGTRFEIDLRRHRNGIARRFDELMPWLLKNGALQRGRVGAADSLLISGLAFKHCMLSLLAQDSGALLRHPEANASYC